MRENFDYITALAAAVVSIDADGWATWSAAHSGDPYFTQINARLLILSVHYNQATIDAVCQYMVSEDLVPAIQTVPSEDFWPYKLSARFSDGRGVIQKRVPEHVAKSRSGARIGAPGSWRYGTREVFTKCMDCLYIQPALGGSDDKLLGPMGRDKWFAESGPSGLFWVNYFNQQTLDWMYGPGKPNKWPFDYQTPPWCVKNQYSWRLNAYDEEGYASLGIVYYPVPGSSYGSGINIYMLIAPDLESENPGDMEVGKLFSQSASMNTEYEVRGAYSDLTVDPLPAEWTLMNLSVSQYEDDPWLYQMLDFQEMDGSYLIYLFVSSDLNFNEPYDEYDDEFGGEWY